MTKKELTTLTKAQLIEYILQQQESKKYGLVWENETAKETIIATCANNRPTLKEQPKKAIITNKKGNNNLLIEGDNYHALYVLQSTYSGKVDMIYIDPPYNTGKVADFMYNDKYVDAQDSFKHSKWLAFMYARLVLAKNLLAKDGVIFISIDDNEIAQLKLLCNEIFGEQNFIAQIIRKNKTGAGHDSAQIAIEFDYMLCYALNKNLVVFEKEKLDVANDAKYKLADVHVATRGKYYLRDLDYKGTYSLSGDYAITTPDGTKIFAGDKKGRPNTWRWSSQKVQWGIANDFIVFKKNKEKWKVYIKQYQYVDKDNKQRERAVPHRAIVEFLNSAGSTELNNIVQQNIFRFPKSTELIQYCLTLIGKKDALVLDFFAGSGTTGHAVLKANKADNGSRRFILCTNNENDICEKVTYPRLKKVIEGYENLKGTKLAGLGGNLQYYKTALKK